MAKRKAYLAGWCGRGAVALAFVAAGCAAPSKGPKQGELMVQSLPTPNFEGPNLDPPPPPIVATKPPPPAVLPQETAGIPRDWVPLAQANAWQWIVIHHSATPTGGAAAFDKIHRAKGWDELGYHFVIGNGTDTRDGQIEVGGRWPRQKWGAHAKTPDNRFNDYGIGICLVGNFDVTQPTPEQMKSLSKLVAYLMKTYHVPPSRVVGHSDTGRATDCPGRLMNVAQVRQLSTKALADAGDEIPAGDTRTAAAGELLRDASH